MLGVPTAWVNSDRAERLKAVKGDCFIEGAPDFLVEIVSVTRSIAELQAKMGQWIGNGAQVGWLIDPAERAVTIYRQGQAAETLVDPTSVQGDGPIAGFELVMNRIW